MLATDSTNYGTINKDAIIEMSEQNLGLKPLTEKYFNETCGKVKAFAKILTQQQADILTQKTALEGRIAFFFANYGFLIVPIGVLLSMFVGGSLVISSIYEKGKKDENLFTIGMRCLIGAATTTIFSLIAFTQFKDVLLSCRPQILKNHSKLDRQLKEMNQQWSRQTKFTHIMDQLADFRFILDDFKAKPNLYSTKYLFDFLDDLINQVHEYTSIVSKDVYKIILMDQLIQALSNANFAEEWDTIISSSHIKNLQIIQPLSNANFAEEWDTIISSSHIKNLQNFPLWKRLGIENPSRSNCDIYFEHYSNYKEITSFIDGQMGAFLDTKLTEKRTND